VVIASFAVHVFLNPYQKLFQNIVEMLVLLNYTAFLLLRSNETVLDAVNSGLYSGNLVMNYYNSHSWRENFSNVFLTCGCFLT